MNCPSFIRGYGIEQSRILIKIASTWEGIQAAKVLEAEGIPCNLTLLFGLHQAQACADAKVTLISPFVGRILDCIKKLRALINIQLKKTLECCQLRKSITTTNNTAFQPRSWVQASAGTAQVLGLAGCDLLTIAPNLLAQLDQDQQTVTAQLSSEAAQQAEKIERPAQTKESFKVELEQDLMAFQLLQSGIDGFIQGAGPAQPAIASVIWN